MSTGTLLRGGLAGLLILALLAGPPTAARGAALTTTRVATGLSAPVWVTAPPGDRERLFIVEAYSGRIKILKNGTVLGTPFIDLGSLVTDAGGEQGLLGLAFHPAYASNGFFYVYYIDNSGQSVVARYQVTSNPDVGDPGSAQILLTQSQPTTVHKGGTIAFGPEGYLYIGLGDGGGSTNGQNDGTLLGKMLRIDVDGGSPYAIPPDNPFVGAGNPLDEIWMKGFRNPYRWSFDRETGHLYIGDVGQSRREEIDFQPNSSPGGENYGWRLKEGTLCYIPSTDCDPGGLTNPIHEYAHESGRCSVTGGAVYRGCANPDLRGTYFFADYCSDEIWSFRYTGSAVAEFTDRTAELDPPGALTIVSSVAIGEDGSGELHIVSINGDVYKVVPQAPVDCNQNATPDGCDIAEGTSSDSDYNGVPDECQAGAVPALGSGGTAGLVLLLLAGGAALLRRRASRLLALVAILALPIAAEAQTLDTVRVASGLSGPVFATAPPGDTQRLFIVEFNTGRIKILENGSVLATPFLDIGSLVTNNTNFGLLGLTFHPNYASNGYFYVQYVDNALHPTVARYTVSGDPDVADSSSAQIVIQLADFAIVDHQGGTVAFGPDGYLYVAFGDGQACDPANRAQNDGDLHGKMLRLDVNGDDFPADPNRNYAIPSTNPFVGAGNPLDEIWAKGFRNPFRFTFDRATGDLWEADVGQGQREEINFQPAGNPGGQNYGWRIKEGTACFNAVSGCTPNATCPCAGCTDPIHEYAHSAGNCSISGGSVYRGSAILALAGTYFFGDWCSARIWSLKYNGSSVTDFTDRTAELAPGGGMTIDQPVAIGEDGAGELYIVDMGGEIYKIVSPAPSIPALGGPGAAALVLLLGAGGVLAVRRRRRAGAARSGSRPDLEDIGN